MRILSLLVLGILALLVTAQTAQADFLGNTLTIEWHYDDLGEVIYSEVGPVGAGVEFVERAGGSNVDVSNASIHFFGADAQSYTATNFNGFVFTDTNGTIAAITGVSIASQTGYGGFNAADITFTADRINVNFEDAGPIDGPNDHVVLRVQFGQAVPEPSSLALFGLAGLGGLALARRRRRNAA